MHSTGGEAAAGLSSISRRTRSKWDAFYKSRHDEIKKKPPQHHQQDDHIIINGQDFLGTDHEDKSYIDTDDDDSTSTIQQDSDHDHTDSHDEKSDDDDVDDDSDDDSDDGDDDFGDEDYKVKVVQEKKGTRQVQRRPPAAKRNKAAAAGEARTTDEGDQREDLIEMFLDSILCNEKDLLLRRQRPPANHPHPTRRRTSTHHGQSSLLPLKFRFEEDDHDSCSLPLRKTDHQREIDSLFHDLELGLWESHTNSSSISDEEECSMSRDMDDSPAARCGRGDHDVVLDDQIGILCQYCYAVLLDIKHVLPPFYVESPEKRSRKQAFVSEEEEESYTSTVSEMQFPEESTISSRCGNLECTSKKEGISSVLDLIPNNEKQQLYPHQLQGLEFLWRNIAGDILINNLQNLPAYGGRGCIISHAPGTGKTRLTIVFLQTFMKLYPNCHPVIIAPPGMLLTWEQEFAKWNVDIKFHNLNENKLSPAETEFAAATLAEQTQGLDKNSIYYFRLVKLCCWDKCGGVLGVGYRLFEKLAGDKHMKKKKLQCKNNIKNNSEKFKKILLETPGLLVMDEGHTPRNNKSLMWKALTNTSTHRRIILSGTPFQNNLTELYNTLCLVNPTFSQQITNRRTKKRKRQKEAARDRWAYLTNSISKNDERVKELRSMIEPFVHIHKGDILEKTLPGMRDCMVVLRPTDLQNKLVDKIDQKFLKQAYLASLISVHPSLVANEPGFSHHKTKLKSLELDPNAGVKTQFLMKLIQLSVRIHEKVLVFSQYLDPLQHIMKLIKRHFCWQEGRQVIYMDGDLNLRQRQLLINSFNDKHSEAKVLLASQRACSEGINLVGASRLVLLDVAWNPSVERQAICRAYRIGQEKMVYVYHLVTLTEVNKYVRQAEKDRISQLIFGLQGGGGGGGDGVVWEDKVLEAMVGQQSGDSDSMFERIVHQPKESDLVNTFGFVDS